VLFRSDWRLAFDPPAPARHLIETCGVPHTEVELILHEGASIGLETPVGDGDRLAVYPMFESFDVRPLLRLRPRPLRRPRFLWLCYVWCGQGVSAAWQCRVF